MIQLGGCYSKMLTLAQRCSGNFIDLYIKSKENLFSIRLEITRGDSVVVGKRSSIFSRPALKKKEQGRERARWRERREKRCGISAQPAARKREREKKKTPCHKSKAAPCSTVMDDRGASDAKKAPKGFFFSLSLFLSLAL